MRTIRDGSRALVAHRYIEPAIGRVGYYTWPGGVVPAEGGARASNNPAPPIQEVIRFGSLFCAADPNLKLRRVDKRIPIAQFQSPLYDGGIAAYWGTPVFPSIGAGYFAGYMDSFDLGTALRWAYDDRIPVLAGWRYTGVAQHLQGHVYEIYPSGWILESVPGAGLRWARAEGSYAARNSTVMVRGRDWIEYQGDQVR